MEKFVEEANMEGFIKKAEENLRDSSSYSSPECYQVLALRGIGYALLAVASAIAGKSKAKIRPASKVKTYGLRGGSAAVS